ncbi:MAG: hypothetical protein F9K19_22845 [Rhizobiaceae bacterium]|nr:MAG: hypothetical protein F9K19_22845 [Rhizobiaceae bacterium]CAG0975228.1 hypothetical protein RHIZO_01440 [Rhizobiaceae bacterium]
MAARSATGRKHAGLAPHAWALLLAGLLACSPAAVTPAWALSEIQQGDVPAATPDGGIEKEPLPPVEPVPLPDPVSPPASVGDEPATDPTVPAAPAEGGGTDGETDGDGGNEAARPEIDPNAPVPEIHYDLGALPEPVRRMRDLIVEAAKSGEIERLRPLVGTGDDTTQLALGGIDGDPIAFLEELSGDEGGQEILAILEEVLEAGYVHLDAGTSEELYVWPYFFAVPLERLTPPQRVELFKIVTAGDYEDMKSYGAYIFYRVGITPEGRWQFFVAGD